MVIACWSAKGGSGTTVVAASLAVLASRASPSGALVADLSGDLPAVLGLPDPDRPGLAAWLAAGDGVPDDALDRLTVRHSERLGLLPWGGASDGGGHHLSSDGGERLLAELRRRGTVVVDCGSSPTGAALAVAAGASTSLLVTRPCYLALRRALAAPIRPSAAIVIDEPERSLRPDDVGDVLGVPVRAVVPFDTRVARAVDAGMLAARVPRCLRRALLGTAS